MEHIIQRATLSQKKYIKAVALTLFRSFRSRLEDRERLRESKIALCKWRLERQQTAHENFDREIGVNGQSRPFLEAVPFRSF